MIAALVVAGSLALLAGAAGAQYIPTGSLTLDRNTVPQGGTVTATAKGYADGAAVTFVVNSVPLAVGTITANADGTAVDTFVVPADFPTGTHTVTSDGVGASGDPLHLAADLTVTAVGTSPTTTTSTGSLPTTGSDNTKLLWAGALLIAGGAVVVLGTRRKRANGNADA